MLLVESAGHLLLGVFFALVLALHFDLAARLVRPLGLLRFVIGRLRGCLVADPVLLVVHVATELVLVVVDLLPLLGMSARTLSAMLPVTLARLANLR